MWVQNVGAAVYYRYGMLRARVSQQNGSLEWLQERQQTWMTTEVMIYQQSSKPEHDEVEAGMLKEKGTSRLLEYNWTRGNSPHFHFSTLPCCST